MYEWNFVDFFYNPFPDFTTDIVSHRYRERAFYLALVRCLRPSCSEGFVSWERAIPTSYAKEIIVHIHVYSVINISLKNIGSIISFVRENHTILITEVSYMIIITNHHIAITFLPTTAVAQTRGVRFFCVKFGFESRP